MLLRRSGEAEVKSFDLTGITTDTVVGVENESELIEIAEAVYHGDSEKLADVRARAAELLGEQSLVDAIGVASAFNGITRVANATGLPLDDTTEEVTVEMRQTTGIDDYADDHKAGIYDA